MDKRARNTVEISFDFNNLKEEKELNMTLTKADLVDSIYEKVGFSKKEAADLVELIFDTLKDQLARGEKIKISGFGNFVVREKKPRMGRNPQTGQSIEISARRVLTFKPSQVLRAEVNASLSHKPIVPGSGDKDSDED